MSLNLFPTPVECPECGFVSDDPASDRCPKCGALLMERRNPSRLAGVERKYRSLRILLPALRFLGAVAALTGLLVFIFADDGWGLLARLLSLFIGILVGAGLFVTSTLIQVIADLEENSRASFSVQNALLERLRGPARSGE